MTRPAVPEIHREDVKAAVRKRGSSLADIARELDVSVNAVSQVLRGATTSARIEVALARASGFTLVQIRGITRRPRRKAKRRAA